ncbi:MAG: SEC-C domain-containing protein [Deferrisomatales bacterium]
MIAFASRFPEVAARETRVVTVTRPGQPLPPGSYAFVEFYCDDPGCDCRRVMFWVFREPDQTPLATISYGFDAEDDAAGPFLDPFGPQSAHGEPLLALFSEVVLADSAYVERLYRHYLQMRELADGNRYRGRPFPKPGPRPPPEPDLGPEPALERAALGGGRNTRCPCGSGKKAKRCCGTEATAPQANAAETLVAAATQALRRNQPLTRPDEVEKRLFAEPNLGSRLLDLLLAEPAPDPRKEPSSPRYGACVMLLESVLTQLRFSAERNRAWAVEALARLRADLAERAFRPTLAPRIQGDVLAALSSAGVEPGPEIQRALGQLAGSRAGRSEGPDLGTLAAGFEGQGEGAAYALWEELFAYFQAVEPGARVGFVEAAAGAAVPLLREVVVLLLLHPEAEVRQAAAQHLLTTGGAPSPVGLRRLILLRNWLPEAERPAADALIGAARLARIEPAPSPAQQVTVRLASPFDGSGATSFLLGFRDKRRTALGGAVLKEGFGVRDPWCSLRLPRGEAEDTAARLRQEVGAVAVGADYLATVAGHFLWVGAEAGRPPAPPFLQIAELAGAAWAARPLDFDAALADLEGAAGPAAFAPAEVQRVLLHGVVGTGRFPGARSWFEDDAAADDAVRRALGQPTVDRAIAQVIQQVLEPRRDRWAERLLWMALWGRAATERGAPPWKQFAVLARELRRGRPLGELPLMAIVARQTVEAALARGNLQRG